MCPIPKSDGRESNDYDDEERQRQQTIKFIFMKAIMGFMWCNYLSNEGLI